LFIKPIEMYVFFQCTVVGVKNKTKQLLQTYVCLLIRKV